MLTHVVQSSDKALFLIDEPDIYLHSDLQRQLLGLLRNLGPDILIATHSIEIITDAEPDDILVISKNRGTAKRLRDPSQLEDVFRLLGSNLNPILTQLAKTRRAIFVEGKDFQILGRFATKLGVPKVGNRSEFAVVPVEGFNPDRIRSLKTGMETTLGAKIRAAAIFDKDYRSDEECKFVASQCRGFCDLVVVHERKEVENFLLVPTAIDRAAEKKNTDQVRRGGKIIKYVAEAEEDLENFARASKAYVTSQYLAERRRFERKKAKGMGDAAMNEAVLNEFETLWRDAESRLKIVPGKEALSVPNRGLQDRYGISVTPTAIIDVMRSGEVPDEMRDLIKRIAEFAASSVE